MCDSGCNLELLLLEGGQHVACEHSSTGKEKAAQRGVGRKLGLMSLFIAAMFLLELFGGLRSGSLALVSDAFHMLSDGLSLLVAMMCLKLSKRPSSDWMSFGWERAEILGGLINGVALITVCGFIMMEGLSRLVEPEPIESPSLVVAIGCVSLVFNCGGVLMFREHGAHGHSHAHSHGDSHGHSHGNDEDMNVRAIFLHILGDALASLAVVVSGVVVIYSDWEFKHHVDPFVSIGISLGILYGTLSLVKRACVILMQATPASLNFADVKQDIRKVDGVVGVHHLHIWQLFKRKLMASVHVNIGDPAKHTDVLRSVQNALHSHGIHSSTVQVELHQQGCGVSCGPACADDTCCPAELAQSII